MDNSTFVFCTIFDSNYMYQGVALYYSLERHLAAYRFYCLALDDVAADTILKLSLKNAILVKLSDLRQDWINEIRPRMSFPQFCWTMQPILCLHLLDLGESTVTYIEADSWFFSSPEPLFKEIGSRSISLAPHWFAKQFKKYQKTSGHYCTHFNFFRNDDNGRNCLEYWRDCCFRYCAEKPLFIPGQTCLNEWDRRFKEVCILTNRGAGIAPWNVRQYELLAEDGRVLVDKQPAIFYHYHQLARYRNGDFDLGNYPLSDEVIGIFYVPYVREILRIEKLLKPFTAGRHHYREIESPPSLMKAFLAFSMSEIIKATRPMRRKWKGIYNVYPETYFLHGGA